MLWSHVKNQAAGFPPRCLQGQVHVTLCSLYVHIRTFTVGRVGGVYVSVVCICFRYAHTTVVAAASFYKIQHGLSDLTRLVRPAATLPDPGLMPCWY